MLHLQLQDPLKPRERNGTRNLQARSQRLEVFVLRNHSKDKMLFFCGCLSKSSKAKGVATSSGTHARRCQIFSICHQAGKSTAAPAATEIWKATPRSGRASTPCWDFPHHHQPCFWSCSVCSNYCHSQPGVPSPSNALSICKIIHL